MTTPLDELKIRARLRQKTAQWDDPATSVTLGDCLRDVARAVGFLNWDQARRVLGGLAVAGDDMGGFWHAPQTLALLNPWYRSHAEAVAGMPSQPGKVLLPYRRQCLLAGPEYLRELGLDPADPLWDAVARDMVQASGSPAWQALVLKRLAAEPARFSGFVKAPSARL